jgi:hypothetical protein
MGIDIVIVDAGMPWDDVNFRLLLVAGKHNRREAESLTKPRSVYFLVRCIYKRTSKSVFLEVKIRGQILELAGACVLVQHELRSGCLGPFVYSHCITKW